MTRFPITRIAKISTAPGIVTATMVVVITVCSACALSFDVRTRASGSSQSATVTGQITVFAASSLTDAFTELGEQFTLANPGTVVSFNFGASTQLFTQLDQGAAADVFAPADQVQMDRARAAGRISGPSRVFATNRLVVITPGHNPGQVRALSDLARPGLKLVTSQEEVPVGVYTQAVFNRMSQDPQYGAEFVTRVNANLVSREPNARQIVAKIQLGEADAAVVYLTDVTPPIDRQLNSIEIPDSWNTLAVYPFAQVASSPNPAGADEFISFVLSPIGQATLAKWRFGTVTNL